MSRYTVGATAKIIFVAFIITQISIAIEIQNSSGLIVGNINYIQDLQQKRQIWHDVRAAVTGSPKYIQVTQPGGMSPVILDSTVSNSQQNLLININEPIIVAHELRELSRGGKFKLINT